MALTPNQKERLLVVATAWGPTEYEFCFDSFFQKHGLLRRATAQEVEQYRAKLDLDMDATRESFLQAASDLRLDDTISLAKHMQGIAAELRDWSEDSERLVALNEKALALVAKLQAAAVVQA